MVLRIEDTDSKRFVPGAEEYIVQSLRWLGIAIDEGVGTVNGEYGPYRQSERKELYKEYVSRLLEGGRAYYAFDTPEELEQARARVSNFSYDALTRLEMRNGLTLGMEQAQRLVDGGEPYVVRFKVPLILKPSGSGKLSKRDGDKFGFPVFPLEWVDPESGAVSMGYREQGYLPEAVINFLALLGWNPGTDQELFSMEELIAAFAFERCGKGGARFDFEKAKWFNHQYVQRVRPEVLMDWVLPRLEAKGLAWKTINCVRLYSQYATRCSCYPICCLNCCTYSSLLGSMMRWGSRSIGSRSRPGTCGALQRR